MNWIFGALLLVVVFWLGVCFFRSTKAFSDVWERTGRADLERLERELRDEVARSALGTRQELSQALVQFQQVWMAQQGDGVRTQNEQMGRFSSSFQAQMQALMAANDLRMNEVKQTVHERLMALQLDNEKKLEQMRATVDEKLQATLEQRLGESFKQVADRLEQVHRGLGDMQNLARDVGSLNRVLTNVKTRGIFGEVQLAGLLEQVFTPEQFAVNVETVPGTGARVEFAVKLPGQRSDGVPLWLPIDAKFPREDYERLLDAQDQADAEAAAAAGKALEQHLRSEAKTIRDKYVAPPHTTDFGILFLPTEGLYAEALRRPGLMEALQREYRVMLAGPTTLLATLNSLQMGFRTLALEKRSVEVWEILGAVKTEFVKFGGVLEKIKTKLTQATGNIDDVQTRTNVMNRKLRSLEVMPDEQASALLLMPSLKAGEEDLTEG